MFYLRYTLHEIELDYYFFDSLFLNGISSMYTYIVCPRMMQQRAIQNVMRSKISVVVGKSIVDKRYVETIMWHLHGVKVKC